MTALVQAGVRTTCPYCGVGCGVLATPDGQGGAAIAGDAGHPANLGRLCSKGAALGETLDLDGRLLEPLIDGAPVGWDAALDAVADSLHSTLAQHGPQAVAFYVSGQLLNEDYYVANKLMKGFIGANNIDTNSRLCMASTVAGHVRAFGADTVPGCYEDLELADLLLLVGSNTAWCHPVLFQRIRAAKQARPGLRVVVIDPRRTPTCDIADLHLPLAPGSDVALFNGLLVALAERGAVDEAYVAAHVEGFDAALAQARAQAPDAAAVAAACDLPVDDVARLFDLFASTERVVTVFSQGVNQSAAGTDKVNALINCHLATGRIGRPGMGPLSFTGQPNAMGGREVGGLASTLACHLDYADAGHRALVQDFWGSGPISATPGLKAVDLFEAIESGQVRWLWIMGTNPLVSLPQADRFRAALAKCQRVIVSDCVRDTDTTAFAHILLPALAWGEKSGTVTNSERRISRQRPFLPPPGRARADWWALASVAQRLGFSGFEYASEADIFDEYARLSALAGAAGRDFDIGGLAGLDRAGYDALEPVQWPVPAAGAGTARLFADGRFYTPSGRARMLACASRLPGAAPDADYPLILNTGRVRDHWHTLTRTGKSARLSGHIAEPRLDVNPTDAARLGLVDGGFADVESRHGRLVTRVAVDAGLRVGEVFLPMHWGRAFASTGPADALVDSVRDPVSGQPQFKLTPVRVAPVDLPWRALLLTRDALRPTGVNYYARARIAGGWRYRIAARQAPADAGAWLRGLAGLTAAGWQWLDYADPTGEHRVLAVAGERAQLALFAGDDLDWLADDWLTARFDAPLDAAARRALLAGVPGVAGADPGRTVCACFQVGINTLVRAIAEQGLDSPQAIGAALKAGTNCGSCVPELRQILAAAGRAA